MYLTTQEGSVNPALVIPSASSSAQSCIFFFYFTRGSSFVSLIALLFTFSLHSLSAVLFLVSFYVTTFIWNVSKTTLPAQMVMFLLGSVEFQYGFSD